MRSGSTSACWPSGAGRAELLRRQLRSALLVPASLLATRTRSGTESSVTRWWPCWLRRCVWRGERCRLSTAVEGSTRQVHSTPTSLPPSPTRLLVTTWVLP